MNVSEKDIGQALRDDNWTFSNNLIYDMCLRHFEHKNIDIVMAKVCIIGRVYSASIERRTVKREVIASDSFYEDNVAPAVKTSDIHKWLNGLKRFNEVSRQTLPIIIETHSKVVDLFRKISGMNKRSLASKYLHFHLPDLFYIYDSRAVDGLRRILPRFRTKNLFSACDPKYSKFCQKVFWLQQSIEHTFRKRLTPRQLDRLLLKT